MSKLEEDLEGLSELGTQQARIAEAKRILRQCHLAGLLDAMAVVDDILEVMTVTSVTGHLDKQAYRQLKATMDDDQRSRLNLYNVGCDLSGGRRINTLKGLLDFMGRTHRR